MKKALFVLFILSVLATGPAWAVEKVKIGTALKIHPVFALPMLAAQEKGFFLEQGLEVDWLAFSAAGALHRAAAAGRIPLALDEVTGTIQAIARGVPLIIVSDLGVKNDFSIWVRTDSLIIQPRDLRGKRIDVGRLGGASHAYARAVARALGIEKEVAFMAAGGTLEGVAALKSGAVDSSMKTLFAVAPLVLKREIRELVAVPDYLPKEWMSRLIFAQKEAVTSGPQTVARGIKAILAACQFIMKDRSWAVDRMQSFSQFTQEAAQVVYPKLVYTQDGRVNRRALVNVREFLISYGILSAEKIPRVEELYTDQFVR